MRSGYREFRPPAEVERVVACLWENRADSERVQPIVPDGCVDLIWDRGLVVAGADTGPREVGLSAGARVTGIRLRPGAAGAVLGLPASEIRDERVAAALLWDEEGASLEAALAGAEPAQRPRLLADAVARRRAELDGLVHVAARRLSAPGGRVAGVARDLGVSERQLRRRTLAAVGYGPKLLARVARLRRLAALAEDSLAARAYEAGYSSQAHMSDEVRRLTGTTAVRFLEDGRLTAA